MKAEEIEACLKRAIDALFELDAHLLTVDANERSISLGKLLPREVVRPVSEQGKWIQFEYYHWLMQEYQTGWALKKYFKRVPATYSQENSR